MTREPASEEGPCIAIFPIHPAADAAPPGLPEQRRWSRGRFDRPDNRREGVLQR